MIRPARSVLSRGLEPRNRFPPAPGVTLIELLCVLAIIGILLALMGGPFGRALGKARSMKRDLELMTHVERLEQAVRRYTGANPRYVFSSLDDLLVRCAPGGSTERYLKENRAQFEPFSFVDPDTKLVLVIPAASRRIQDAWIEKGQLTKVPE